MLLREASTLTREWIELFIVANLNLSKKKGGGGSKVDRGLTGKIWSSSVNYTF
jgi:hypothetical protein